MHPPFYKWTESAHAEQRVSTIDMGCYNFMSGAGGWAQSLYHGFGGIEYTEEGVLLRPVLVRAIAPRIVWRGLRVKQVVFRLEASAEEARATGDSTAEPRERTHATVCVTEGVARVTQRGGDGSTLLANGACASFVLATNDAGLLLLPQSTV